MTECVLSPGDVPTLRIVSSDRRIEVHCDADEWADLLEAAEFAAWLEPIVVICCEHDEIARATGQPELTAERIASELAETARTLLAPAYLSRQGERWRFRGGPCPDDPPAREWGRS